MKLLRTIVGTGAGAGKLSILDISAPTASTQVEKSYKGKFKWGM